MRIVAHRQYYIYIYIYTRIFGPRFARPRFFEDPKVPCNTTALRLDWKTGPFRNFLAVASRLSRRDSTLHRVVGNTIDDVGAYFLSVPAKVLERWTQVMARPCFDIGVRYITLAHISLSLYVYIYIYISIYICLHTHTDTLRIWSSMVDELYINHAKLH